MMKTISTRMIAFVCALFCCLLLLGGISSWTQNQQMGALNALYGDGDSSLRKLKVISDRYAVDVVDAAHKARNGSFTFEESKKAMNTALQDVQTIWPPYLAAIKDAEERKVAQDADGLLTKAKRATQSLISFLEANDKKGLEEFTISQMYPAIDPGTELIGKLIDIQIAASQRAYQEVKAAGARATYLLTVAALLGILTAATAVLYVIFGVVRPLKNAIGTMGELAQEKLETPIAGTARPDELGLMARALERFKETGIERRALSVQAEAERNAREARANRIEAIIGEFESATMSVVSTVASASAQLEASAKMMMETAENATEQAAIVSTAAQETTQSVQILAETGEQLASSISEIGHQAEQSSHYASSAAMKARATDTTVQKLSTAGKAIVEVVDLIKSIASQTNLLALNATIEAARAGEAGRGFAVVASEVKELATQTTRATDVISEHVSAIQEASGESIVAMQDIMRTIEEINQVASSIAVAVAQQSAAAQGIAENVQQVAKGSENASQSINIVNEASNNTGAAAGEVLGAAEELAIQSQAMRDKMDWFLSAVRAA